MRKIKHIIIIIIVILLSSCQIYEVNKQNATTNDEAVDIYVQKFTYDGHDYIQFQLSTNNYDNSSGWVHDPECRKCNNN